MIQRINKGNPESLLFFNPMSCDINFWKKTIPSELINNYDVLLINYPGYSSPFIPFPSFQDLADYYHKKVLSKLDKPMHLIGYSYGGLLVQHLLNNHYDNLESVTLIGCSNKLAVRDREIVSIFKNIVTKDLYLFSRILSILSHNPEEIEQNPLIGLQKFSNLKLTVEDYQPILQQLNHILKVKEIEVRDQQVPAMLIYGDQDRLIETSTINRFKEFLEHLEIVKLKGESHILDMENVFHHIVKFLKKQKSWTQLILG